MDGHQVTIDPFKGMTFWTGIASSSEDKKTLRCVLEFDDEGNDTIKYQVRHNDKIVFTTSVFRQAIREYNNI